MNALYKDINIVGKGIYNYEVVKQAVYFLFNTRKGDLVYKPDYGLNLDFLLYTTRPLHEIIFLMQGQIEGALSSFLPNVSLEKIELINEDANMLSFDIYLYDDTLKGQFKSEYKFVRALDAKDS